MKGPGRMMLEIALDADEEWDSSSSWDATCPRRRRSGDRGKRLSLSWPTSERPVELSVRLAGDEDVRALNAEWRGKDKPTNVLSFPIAEADELDEQILPDQNCCSATSSSPAACARRRPRTRASASSSMRRICSSTARCTCSVTTIRTIVDAADMEAREVRALARLGIANPYEERRLMATSQRRRRLAPVARHAAFDLRRRRRTFAPRPDRGSDRGSRGFAARRRRPEPARAADAPQPAAFRRPDRRRHLRHPRRHHCGAVATSASKSSSAPSPTPATAACRSMARASMKWSA